MSRNLLEAVEEKRPFHETIVMAIQRSRINEIFCLFDLIKETKVPQGHDEIIAAIDQYFNSDLNFLYKGKYALDIREVKESLLAQKRETEKEAVDKKKEKHFTSPR